MWVDAATAAAAVERAVLALGCCGGEEALFEVCEVGDVAFVAIDRAFEADAVDAAVLEVVET
jgi:hypothetical protein